jgi:arsenate reductase
LLKAEDVAYRYRDYRDEPLTATEIRAVLKKLGLKPTDVLRKKDAAYKKLGLTGTEPAARLVKLMAENPTLLQRPIGVRGKKAVVGRPPESLLELV